MLCLCLNGALQHYDCAELVQDCVVLATVCVLHTPWTAAGGLTGAVLNQLKSFLKQDREQWSGLQVTSGTSYAARHRTQLYCCAVPFYMSKDERPEFLFIRPSNPLWAGCPHARLQRPMTH